MVRFSKDVIMLIFLVAVVAKLCLIFVFLREFQPIAFVPDDSFLLSDQDINQFFV